MRHAALLGCLLVLPLPLAAQPDPPPPLRVFLDCQTGCDENYVRTELPWVDYVRTRQDADLHVLVTSQATGGGGREHHLRFIGLRALQGQDQELRFTTPAAATSDLVRSRLVETLALGLVRYLTDRPEAERLRVTFARPVGPAAPVQPARDPWNRWVFTVSGRGFLFGETRRSSSDLGASLRARRITEDWKLDVSAGGNRSRSTFTLTDGSEFTSNIRGYNGSALVGRSLGSRMAAGVRVNARNSTRDNEDLVLRPTAVVEYSLYPYRESTRRLVTVEYGIGAYVASYGEETIYGVESESLARHYLLLSVDLRQPWGSVGLEASYQSYLRDFSQNRIGLSGSANVHLVKGLSLNMFASYSRPRDQLSLARGEASDEEVLLRLRQLQTNYTYITNVGLSYSFGSIFSAVVNPRLRNNDPGVFGGGAFVMF
jgi:hypothetical protein